MARMRAEDRRRQLLSVAAESFARNGYRATTTAGLAAAAGVTAPVLYHHFSGKHELFTTLLGEACRDAVIGWREAVARSGTAALVGTEAPQRAQLFEKLVLSVLAERPADRTVTAAAKSGLRTLTAAITEAVTELGQSGDIDRKADPAILARLILEWRLGHQLLAPLDLGDEDDHPPPDTAAALAHLLARATDAD